MCCHLTWLGVLIFPTHILSFLLSPGQALYGCLLALPCPALAAFGALGDRTADQ
jgi:hypothetical protein